MSPKWIIRTRTKTSKLETTTGKTSKIKSNGHRESDGADDSTAKNNRRHSEYFNIYNNCHNILRTLQSLLLLMLNCGIFNKRRRRQELAAVPPPPPTNPQDKSVNYTKFLLLLHATLAAAATTTTTTTTATATRLSLSRNNYNQQQQQQQQHNQHEQQQQTKPQKLQQKVEDQTEKQHCKSHKNSYPWNRSLIWILLSLSLLANHATTATAIAGQTLHPQTHQQHHQQHLTNNNNNDDISDRLDTFVESTRLRRAVSQPSDVVRLSRNETSEYEQNKK